MKCDNEKLTRKLARIAQTFAATSGMKEASMYTVAVFAISPAIPDAATATPTVRSMTGGAKSRTVGRTAYGRSSAWNPSLTDTSR